MDLFTITDAALLNIRSTIDRSKVRLPVISLAQDLGEPSADGLTRIVARGASDDALKEAGLYEHRFDLTPVPRILTAGVFERAEVPENCLIAVQGIWFSFAPAWQELLAGGSLEKVAESLVLKNAKGEVLLPIDPGYMHFPGEK